MFSVERVQETDLFTDENSQINLKIDVISRKAAKNDRTANFEFVLHFDMIENKEKQQSVGNRGNL